MNSPNEQRPLKPVGQFNHLLAGGALMQAPGAADSLTARLVQKAGFDAVYLTGFGATATRLGAPDEDTVGGSVSPEVVSSGTMRTFCACTLRVTRAWKEK